MRTSASEARHENPGYIGLCLLRAQVTKVHVWIGLQGSTFKDFRELWSPVLGLGTLRFAAGESFETEAFA